MRPLYHAEYPWTGVQFLDTAIREQLRMTVVRELERSGVSAAELAREIGVSPTTLRSFVRSRLIRPEQRRRLQEWAEDRPPVHLTAGAVIFAMAVELFPRKEQGAARRDLATRLAHAYRESRRSIPVWLLLARDG